MVAVDMILAGVVTSVGAKAQEKGSGINHSLSLFPVGLLQGNSRPRLPQAYRQLLRPTG